MFNSTILDVAIGMIFVYLLLSLMCSAANEIIEMFLKKRAKHLEEGLVELLHDKALVAKIYNHSLVNGLFGGAYKAKSRKLPSYIPSTSFALALMDLVLPGHAATATAKSGAAGATIPPPSSPSPPQVMINVAGAPAPGVAPPPPTVGVAAPAALPNPLDPLRTALQTFPYTQVRDALLPLVDAAGNDAAKARQNIEAWYDGTMDRVSGWYKRRAQFFILIIGLIVAVLVNADSVAIVRALNADKSLREVVVAQATQYMKEAASPTPTPVPFDSAKLTQTTAAKSTPSPKATPKPTPSPTPTPSAGGSPSSPPAPPPACVKDPEGPQCKYEKSLAKIESLGLPIGWDLANESHPNRPDEAHRHWPGSRIWQPEVRGEWYGHLRFHWIGWILTAFAISLGAPFWFDLLNKFIVVRSTVKPKEKSPDEPSKS